MYKLLFDDDSTIEIDNLEAMQVGIAGYNGHNTPKYVYLWIKHKRLDTSKDLFSKWETKFFYRRLKSIFVYDNSGNFTHAIPIPEPFIELHYEEGDLVVAYGSQLYSDEAY